MKTWYRAVCDKHKEMCHVLVSNPGCGNDYLGKYDIEIQRWLESHYDCKLRFIHSDEDNEMVLGKYLDYPEELAFRGNI